VIDLDLAVLVPGLAAVVIAAWALLSWRRRSRQDAVAFHVGGPPRDLGDAQAPVAPAPHAQADRVLHAQAEARALPAEARVRALRVVAMVLLALAAAAPRWSGIPEPSGAERTLVIVLDVSMSMLAADVAPSRLDEAKRQVLAGLGGPPAGRLALVAFAAEPTLVCPPTTDRAAFTDLLSAAREDAAPAGPSRASLGLLRALALVESVPGDVVLVTDGDFAAEDRERLREVVRLARKQGTTISTVGVGTDAGAIVPLRDGAPGQPGRDGAGQPMASRLDGAMLGWLAQEGGGEYLRLQPGGQVDLVAATERVRLAGDRAPAHLRPFGPVSLFGYPLVGAILLLLADTWLSWRRRRTGAVTAALAVAAVVTLVGSPARAQSDVAAIRRGNTALSEGRPADAATDYRRALEISPASAIARANLGTALYVAGQIEPAVETLASAIDGLADLGHRSSAHYNLGNALARLGRYDDALASYRSALRLRDDEAARFNYALVWRLRAAQGSTGPSPEPPIDPQRLQQLRDKARSLDVPVVRQLSDRKTVTDDR
jgi:Ca-activated chloride channel family protein